MNNEFTSNNITSFKDYWETWCTNCNAQLMFLPIQKNPNNPHEHDNLMVKCPECNHLTADVTCSKCGTGGAFIQNTKDKPTVWECPQCKTTNYLNANVYNNPILAISKNTAPNNLKNKFEDTNNKNTMSQAKQWLLIAIGTVVLMGVITIAEYILNWINTTF